MSDSLAPMQLDPARAAAQAFVRFDGGGKGYLTRHELRCAHIALLGHPPSLVCTVPSEKNHGPYRARVASWTS